jgi:hypothetical protein
MAAIYSNGGNRWNILGFNFTKRDALSSVYKISMAYLHTTYSLPTLTRRRIWALHEFTEHFTVKNCISPWLITEILQHRFTHVIPITSRRKEIVWKRPFCCNTLSTVCKRSEMNAWWLCVNSGSFFYFAAVIYNIQWYHLKRLKFDHQTQFGRSRNRAFSRVGKLDE